METKVSFFSSANSPEELVYELNKSFERISKQKNLKNAAFQHNYVINHNKRLRLGILANTIQDLKGKFDLSIKQINEGGNPKGREIYFKQGDPRSSKEIVFAFSGQASQYPNMLKALYKAYPHIKSVYDYCDSYWVGEYKQSINNMIFGDQESEKIAKILKDTKNTHPTIFTSDIALYYLLKYMGVKPNFMIGHSLGEICALTASGALSLLDGLKVVGIRGHAFYADNLSEYGAMASVRATYEEIEEILKNNNLDICIANINSKKQIVISGKADEIDRSLQIFKENSITSIKLNVSHAFHSELMKPAADLFFREIQNIKFNGPHTSIIANQSCKYYSDPEEIPAILKDQIISPVKFTDSINKLYEDGARLFIEVGPHSVLSNLIKNIINDKDVSVLSTNNRNKDDFEYFQTFMAQLFVEGVDFNPILDSD